MWGWFKSKALPFILKNLLPLLMDWINKKVEEGKKVTIEDIDTFIKDNR